ncbi:MAG: serine/threonine protein kinase [Anaerolineaceae bacterium]|nr:MAG: serine/threonine protein kinase [Anaerolineaceae bacterium]
MNDALIGKKLGEYEIESLLGRGGMARVYKGYDRKLDRYAAIKVIESDKIATEEDEEYHDRFLREARAIARLHHPNIVGVYQFGDMDDLYYMAMTFIEGRDLRQIIKQTQRENKVLSHAQILRVMRDIAAALDYAHGQGVIHRDVKPSNIMVTREGGHCILTDFGLALRTQEGTIGNTFGSVHYIAPEQAVSSAQSVPQSDLYSLGVVLYEMLTGRVPFDDSSAMSVALKHISDPPPPASSINPDVSPAVEAMLNRALDKQPPRRYPSGRLFVQALEAALEATEQKPDHADIESRSLSNLALSTQEREQIEEGASSPDDLWPSADDDDTRKLGTQSQKSRPIVLTALDRTDSRAQPPRAEPSASGSRRALWMALMLVALLAFGGLILLTGIFDGGDDVDVLLSEAELEQTAVALAALDDEGDEEDTDEPADPTPTVTSTVTATESPTETEAEQPTPSNTATPEPETAPVTATPTPFMVDASAPGEPPLLLYYTSQQFIIYNRSASASRNIDVRRLSFNNPQTAVSFASPQWTFDASRWRMRPQMDCFQIIDSGLFEVTRPAFCPFLQAFERLQNPFWRGDDEDEMFEVFWDSERVALCSTLKPDDPEPAYCLVTLP